MCPATGSGNATDKLDEFAPSHFAPEARVGGQYFDKMPGMSVLVHERHSALRRRSPPTRIGLSANRFHDRERLKPPRFAGGIIFYNLGKNRS